MIENPHKEKYIQRWDDYVLTTGQSVPTDSSSDPDSSLAQ